MAKFNTVGFEEVEKLFLKQSEIATKAVPKMLEAGAAVLVDAQKQEAAAMKIKDSGDFIKSIKASKVKTLNDAATITVAPTGKDYKGARNAEKGLVIEYGKSDTPARPWMETANAKSEEKVHRAMVEVWEEMNDGN
mgnify:CR=1 FL=1